MKKQHAKNRGMRFLFLLVIMLCFISILGVLLLRQKNITLTFQPESYQASNEQLNNPYCGWYHSYNYKLSSEEPFDGKAVTEAAKKDNNTRICQVQIDLGEAATGELTEDAVAQIKDILTAWASTDKQMILGFYYSVVPEDIQTIYLHIEQLASVVNQYKGSIYALQSFGTVKNESVAVSELLQGQNLLDLMQYEASLVEPSIFIAIDSVQQYEALTGFLVLPSEDMAFTEVLPARLGIYNKSLSNQVSQAEKQAVGTLSRYVPSGGTLHATSGMDDVAVAVEVLSEQGVSFLNADANESVEAWKNATYRGDDIFSGVTVYDYLTTHLGYRYVVSKVKTSFDNWKDEKATISIDFTNSGFSNAYHMFDVSILLKNTKTEEMITLPLEVDNRKWLSGETVSVSKEMDIKSYEKGTYNVYLMMLDSATGEMIRLGNTMPLASNGYQLGVMQIQ